MEGLVKAGAFDNINLNRHSLFNSIPNFITKSKNIYENKSANQIDLFGENNTPDSEVIIKIDDWKFEERLSKEFESVGFFISDHPLNQFKEIFADYNIKDYLSFNNDNEIINSNIAATLLKIQERKTAKGNPYAVLKLTDLTSVFELFIFSDILNQNREIIHRRATSKKIHNDDVKARVQAIKSSDYVRKMPFSERQVLQQAHPQLHVTYACAS